MDQENAQFFARTDISASNTLYCISIMIHFGSVKHKIYAQLADHCFFSGKFPAVLNPGLSQVSDFLGLKFQNQQSSI